MLPATAGVQAQLGTGAQYAWHSAQRAEDGPYHYMAAAVHPTLESLPPIPHDQVSTHSCLGHA